MSLKVITIDFWNTIFDSSSGVDRNKYRLNALITETDNLGCFIKQEELEPAMKSSWEYFNHVWMSEQRTPSTLELVNYFWKKLNLPNDNTSIQRIADTFAYSILAHPPKLVSGVKESLDIISKDYQLGIVSDTGFSPGTILKKLLEKENILEYFTAFSFSDETGVSKPHEKAFKTVLDNFDCEPELALHIGDIEKTDIIGAKNLGMKAIRFDGDSSRYLIKENPEETLADYKTGDWSEIPKLIKKLN
jgi:putative hydrolase of the HAD superfamily